MTEGTIRDPGLYLRMCAPRPVADASASAHAFIEELATLREKHGIADVVYALRVATDTAEGSIILSGARGDQEIAVQLSQMAAQSHADQYAARVARVLGVDMSVPAPAAKKKRGTK
jgi:hypothetical protein